MSNIPIVINNRDRLSTTRALIWHLLGLGYSNIYIIDVVSTYQPLLDWYKICGANVIYLKENVGHKALWNSPVLKSLQDHPWIVYTDSDIELNEKTPRGFIESMIMLAKDYRKDKVGLAIKYHDITNPIYKKVITPIEKSYWANRLPNSDFEIYNSPIDTTFAVIRTDRAFTYEALRIAGDYTSKHVPWYVDFDNMSDEDIYYMEHADEHFATCKKHYNDYKKSK